MSFVILIMEYLRIHFIFFNDFIGTIYVNPFFLCNFANVLRNNDILFGITKRYARLANGNVRNFYCNARIAIAVRAYGVD